MGVYGIGIKRFCGNYALRVVIIPSIWHGRRMAGIPGIRTTDRHRDGNCSCAEP